MICGVEGVVEMDESWQLSIIFLLVIFFLSFSVLAVLRNWKDGYKEVLKNLAQAPLRLLVAIGAIYGVMTDQTWLTILLVSVLFLIVYFTSRKHKQDILELQKENEKNSRRVKK
jgi:lipoprotein signal peptidase